MSVDKKTVDHVAAMLTDDPRIFAEGPAETDWRVRGSNYDRDDRKSAHGDPSEISNYRVLATKIIKAIRTAMTGFSMGGDESGPNAFAHPLGRTGIKHTDDPEELRGQIFTSEFLFDRAGIDEEDLQAAMGAKILIPGDLETSGDEYGDSAKSHWQISDQAFKAARHANAIAKTSPPPPPPPPRRRESPHTEHVAPFTRQLGMLLEDIDMDEIDSDPAGQAAVANVPADGADVKQAAEEIGVDSDEAQEMQNKLEQEKEEKKQREELRKKQVDPLFQQADKGLLDLSTNTATALAQQDNVMQALTGLDRQKDELETLLNKINSLL